jgi:hypothetical protein
LILSQHESISMANWYIAEFLLGVLLVTSFTSIGLLALWAATSTRHWLLRTAVVLVVLSPLLLIPAYEPWIVFALQACMIVSGVQLWRWRTARRDREDIVCENGVRPNGPFRFSLRTLLAIVPLVAVLTAIATRIVANLPEQNGNAWTTIAVNGIGSGCAVLLGAWIFAGKRRWTGWTVAFLLCLGLSAVMAWLDCFFWSVTGFPSWPPDPQGFVAILGPTFKTHPVWAWFVLVPTMVGVTWLVIYVWFAGLGATSLAGESGITRFRNQARLIMARCVFGLMLAILVFPPAFVAWKLLHPQPLPNITPVQPNGLDDIVAAAQVFEKSVILNADSGSIPEEQLATEIAKQAEAYARLRLGLSRECQVSVWPQNGDLMAALDSSMNNTMPIRSAARALMHEADLARLQGRYSDASEAAIDNIRLGQAIIQDGLLLDYLVGIAIEGIGDQSLYQTLHHLDADQCREAIAALIDVERRREPLDAVMHRDRVWEEHAYGWYDHFYLLMGDVVTPNVRGTGLEPMLHDRTVATTRLLIAEAALRAYQLERGELPDRLEQLTPDFLARLPVDPFDPDAEPLRYVRSDDGCVVYSIGSDGKDNGGLAPVRDKGGWVDPDIESDLRLDVHFASDDEGSDGSPADE